MQSDENSTPLWCEDCQDTHETECPLAGSILNVLGEPILNKAEATLPRSLNLKVIDGEKHVVAGIAIPKGTRFGPFEAPLLDSIADDKLEGFFLKVFKKDEEPVYLDPSNEDKCNWMCLVKVAGNAVEQNLSAFQYKDGIMYSAIKDIEVDGKLLVWYAPHYGRRLEKEALENYQNSRGKELQEIRKRSIGKEFEETSSVKSSPAKRTKKEDTIQPKIVSPSKSRKQRVIPFATRKSHRQSEKKFNVKELFSIKENSVVKRNTEADGTEPCVVTIPQLEQGSDGFFTVNDVYSNSVEVVNSDDPIQSKDKPPEEGTSSIVVDEIGGKGIDWQCIECKMVFNDQFALITHVQSEIHTNAEVIATLETTLPEPIENQIQSTSPSTRKSTRVITPSPKKAAADKLQEEDTVDEVATSVKKRGRGRPRKNQSEKHLCEMCEKQFDSRTQLVQHYLKCHQDDLDKLETVDIYGCLECGEGFWKKADYESHMLKSHHGIPCKACDLTLTSMKAYNKHVLMHSEDLIPCGVCNKRFLKTVLQAHLLEEHGRKNMGCTMCPQKFPSTTLLTSHLILDHDIRLTTQDEKKECEQKSDNFTCDLCKAVCEEPGLYISHMHEVHHLLMFRCDHCEKVFGTQNSLKKHLEATHSMKSQFICEYCEKIFVHEPSLKRHVEEVHEQKTLPCDICLKIFPSQRRLHEHMRTVHKIIVSKQSSVIEDLFKCKICDQEMASKGNLRRHMAVHSGQGTESEFKLRNDLKCSLCGVQFNRRYLYMEHLAHHKAKGEKVNDIDIDADDVTCSLCGRVCTTKQNLHRHMAMHEEKPYACQLCDKKFLHEMSLTEHILTDHPEVNINVGISKVYRCEHCPSAFLRRNVYNKHMRKHSNLMYKCGQCESVFKRKDSVQRHNCRVDLESQKLLTCEECGASFKFKENMETHECTDEDILKFKEAKEKMSNKFNCNNCTETFDDQWALKRHKKKHLPKLHECEMCGRKFQCKASLKTHTKVHYKVVHDTDGNTQVVKIPYLKNSILNICPECHCQFSTQKSFINHLKMFHSIEALPCTICPKVLTSEEEISIHTEEHQQMVVTDAEIKKQMVSCCCDQCNRVFLEPARLAKHKRMVHEKQQEFMCDTCGKMFNRKDSLKAHIRSHTQETVAECKDCNKKFRSRIAYDMHVKIHLNQRDFKCTFCEKAFIQKGNLNKHLLTHNHTFNFQCEICKRKFNNPALLKRHALIHDEGSKLQCHICTHKFTRQYFLNKHIKQHHEFQNSCHCEHCGSFLKTVASYRRHMRRKHPQVLASDYLPVMYADDPSKVRKLGTIEDEDEQNDANKEENILQIEQHAKFDPETGNIIQELSVPAGSLGPVLGSVIHGEEGFTVHIIQSPEVVVRSAEDGEVVTAVSDTGTVLQLDDGTAANLTPDVVEGVRVLQQFVELSGRVSEAELTQATAQVTYETVEQINMEAEGREPVWPPHASQGGEQDDGVSSSQGTSQQGSTSSRFALSSEAESSHHEPESTVAESLPPVDNEQPNVVCVHVEEISTVMEDRNTEGTTIPDSTGVLAEPPSDLFLLHEALSIQEREGEIIPHVPSMIHESTVDEEMTASTSGVTPKKRGRKKGSKVIVQPIPYKLEGEEELDSRPRRRSMKPGNPNDMDVDDEEEGNEFNEEDFLKQGIFHTIADKPVTSRARASLPAILQIFKVEDGEIGVFARKTVPKRTQFGPLEGKVRTAEDEISNAAIKWKIQKPDQSVSYVDCSDEAECNWMMFIRPAKRYSEQNLVAFQADGNIYFATMKNIDPKTELKVWYTRVYAEFLGLSVLEATAEEVQEMEENDKTWPCFECNRKFRTSDLLQRHLATHDALHTKPQRGKKSKRGRPRKYPEGYRGRLAMSKLKGAKGLKLRMQEGYACTECGKQFARLYSLTRHMLMHSGEKNFTCPVCKKTFSHTYNKLRHMRKHEEESNEGQRRSRRGFDEEDEDDVWPCLQCDLCFESNDLLDLHSNIHDLRDDEPEAKESKPEGELQPVSFITEVIETAAKEAGITEDGAAKNKDEEAMEVDKTEDDDKENNDDDDDPGPELMCPDCDEEFEDKKTLWLHASAHGQHKPGIVEQYRNAIRCEICKRFLQDETKLEKHMELHIENENSIQCEVCGKSVQSQSALACHMKVHSEDRCLQCPFCEDSFDKSDLLRQHVVLHRKNGLYHCPHCEKIFKEYAQIRKHIRSFHSQKEFPCDHCEKVFPRPDKLRLHLLRHSDKKDFLCANCGKQFKRKDKLKEHMQRMHNPQREAEIALQANKPRKVPFKPQIPPSDIDRFTFKCRICRVGFKRRGMLVNHLAKTHPDVVIDSIPELNLPIVKPNRNYFCAYCEKVYKSSSKRKIHILKNHPGAQLPPSLRVTKGDPNSPMGDPHTAPAGTTTTHYFACAHCPRQYSTKAKMMDHVRKKHMESNPQASTLVKRGATVNQISLMQEQMNSDMNHVIVHDSIQHGVQQVVIGGEQVVFPSGDAAAAVALAAAATGHPATITVEAQPEHGGEVEIQHVVGQDQLQAPQTIQIRYIETPSGHQQAQVIQTEPVQATDLLTQAMTELSQSINEMRQQQGGSEYQPVQQIQRIIHQQGQPPILQTLHAQIPVSQIQMPVSQAAGTVPNIASVSGMQIPISQNLSSGTITVTPIPVTQIQTSSMAVAAAAATQLVSAQPGTSTTTVDLSQVRQNVTQFQQASGDQTGTPQLTQLHTVTQSMSPVPQQLIQVQTQPAQQQQVAQGQPQQNGQQTQQAQPQVFIQGNWAQYPQFR
ncbi:uncharacterized protein [Antedon mediterranea]|uniref:uncharacterized protein n=1 Tax=Antedon mediterranea TaxID=105859 RepID=UPI003AF6D965